MPYTITSNRKNTSTVIHATGANVSLIVAGNSSVSNVATTNEVLTGCYLTQAVWGCDGAGHIQVKRGANLVAVFDSTGQVDWAGAGLALNVDKTANLQIQFIGSANSYIILEVQKEGNFTSEYFQP